jgi:hypothetical protein
MQSRMTELHRSSYNTSEAMMRSKIFLNGGFCQSAQAIREIPVFCVMLYDAKRQLSQEISIPIANTCLLDKQEERTPSPHPSSPIRIPHGKFRFMMKEKKDIAEGQFSAQ